MTLSRYLRAVGRISAQSKKNLSRKTEAAGLQQPVAEPVRRRRENRANNETMDNVEKKQNRENGAARRWKRRKRKTHRPETGKDNLKYSHPASNETQPKTDADRPQQKSRLVFAAEFVVAHLLHGVSVFNCYRWNEFLSVSRRIVFCDLFPRRRRRRIRHKEALRKLLLCLLLSQQCLRRIS